MFLAVPYEYWAHLLFLAGGLLIIVGFMYVFHRPHHAGFGKCVAILGVCALVSAAVIAASGHNLGFVAEKDCPLCGVPPHHR